MENTIISTRFQSTVRAAGGAAVVISSLIGTGCWDSYTFSPGYDEAIEIGALVSLSGANSGAGLVHLAAMEKAVEDANIELAPRGLAVRLSFGDTQSYPFAASVLMNTFLLQSQRITIGPYTSAEVDAVENRIGNSQSLLISPSSTSLALANGNDHIFRLAPNDSHMASSLVDFISEQGHRFLVLVYRNDPWGNSVATEMEREFTAAGGSVISSYGYDSFETSVVDSILTRVQEDITAFTANHPLSEIALQLSSMGEASVFLGVANARMPLLRNIRWYGSDGFVKDWSIFTDVQLAEFAAQVDFTSPTYRVDVPDRFWSVMESVETRTGVTPGTYSLLSYDAVRVAARTLARVGPFASYGELEEMLSDVMADYDGVSGQIDLDVMGDRDGGDYDFYSVRDDGYSYEWVRVNSDGRRA